VKKTIIKGWIGKSVSRVNWTDDDLLNIYRTKGRKFDWHQDDWPPIKVTITIEEEKQHGKVQPATGSPA
jgi:hypothetical protein